MKKGKITQAAFDRFVYRPLSRIGVLGRDVVYGADGAALPVAGKCFGKYTNRSERTVQTKQKEQKEQKEQSKRAEQIDGHSNGHNGQIAVCTRTFPLGDCFDPDIGMMLSVARESLLAKRTWIDALSLALMLPADCEDAILRDISEEAGRWCQEHGVLLQNIDVHISDAVSRPVVTVTAIGSTYSLPCMRQTKPVAAAQNMFGTDSSRQDLSAEQIQGFIVMAGEAGSAGATLLADVYQEKLYRRFPAVIVDAARDMAKELPAEPIINGVWQRAHALSDGGIFGGLWELLERESVGCEVDVKQILIRQETIEVCEMMDINPYQLFSQGAMLLITDQPKQLTEQLQAAGIAADVIGHTTSGHARLLRNGEEIRYLDKPQPDELIHKVHVHRI